MPWKFRRRDWLGRIETIEIPTVEEEQRANLLRGLGCLTLGLSFLLVKMMQPSQSSTADSRQSSSVGRGLALFGALVILGVLLTTVLGAFGYVLPNTIGTGSTEGRGGSQNETVNRNNGMAGGRDWKKDLAGVTDATNGGLVVDGNPPVFHDFQSGLVYSLPYWPKDAEHLVAISPDGRQGIVSLRGRNVTTGEVNFTNGSLIYTEKFNPFRTARDMSPDLSKLIYPDGVILDLKTDKRTQIINCSLTSQYQWMRDSQTIITVDGNSFHVGIIDSNTGVCRQVRIDSASWNAGILLSADRQQLSIFTPGNAQWVQKGLLLTVHSDGTGLKRVSELPIMGRDASPILSSPDGRAVYIGDGLHEAYIINTNTGRFTKAPEGAVAWLQESPAYLTGGTPEPTLALSPTIIITSPVVEPTSTYTTSPTPTSRPTGIGTATVLPSRTPRPTTTFTRIPPTITQPPPNTASRVLPSPPPPTPIPVVPKTYPAPSAAPQGSAGPGIGNDCEWTAEFISDRTIQDGEILLQSSPYTKVWTVRNNGMCEWRENSYTIERVSGEDIEWSTLEYFPSVAPGRFFNVIVEFTSPVNTGKYNVKFRFRGPNGLFGPTLTLVFEIVGPLYRLTSTPIPQRSKPAAPTNLFVQIADLECRDIRRTDGTSFKCRYLNAAWRNNNADGDGFIVGFGRGGYAYFDVPFVRPENYLICELDKPATITVWAISGRGTHSNGRAISPDDNPYGTVFSDPTSVTILCR